MTQEDSCRILELAGSDALALAESVWPCYDQVFGDIADYATWRSDLYERHTGRDGFRLVAALDGDDVVGFAWGYVGQRGQFWSDLVSEALPPAAAEHWVGDHFEFVELAVLPAYRRRGVGQTLHDRLLDQINRRCLLSTNDDPDDPAVRLYTRAGWTKLGMLRPNVQVMGLDRTQQGEGHDAVR